MDEIQKAKAVSIEEDRKAAKKKAKDAAAEKKLGTYESELPPENPVRWIQENAPDAESDTDLQGQLRSSLTELEKLQSILKTGVDTKRLKVVDKCIELLGNMLVDDIKAAEADGSPEMGD